MSKLTREDKIKIYERRKKGKTIVVVDHTEEAFQYFSYNIKLKVEDNYIKIDS